MIRTQSLTKYYGKTKGIENLDLSIEKGEIFGLLGPNGAGKTTTIRMLMGLIKPTKGSSVIDGLNCWKESVGVKKICGYIPGEVHLYPNATGNELINVFAAVYKSKNLANDLIKRFDYDPSKKTKNLSKGNKQKLAIILATMHRPDVLILDEPTSGLDPFMQQEFYKLLKEFEANGATILISSHFLPEVEKVCQKVGIIRQGGLVGIENVNDLHTKHLKIVEVTFEGKPNLEDFNIPEVKELGHELNNHYHMKIKGNINPVIEALAKNKVKDLSFEHASLEEIFMEYYS